MKFITAFQIRVPEKNLSETVLTPAVTKDYSLIFLNYLEVHT